MGERGGGIRAGAWRGKGGLHSEIRRFQGEVGHARRVLRRRRRNHEWVSGRKSSPKRCAESWFRFKSRQT